MGHIENDPDEREAYRKLFLREGDYRALGWDALVKSTIEWGKECGIYDQSTLRKQFDKFCEEVEEFTDEMFPPDGGPVDMGKVAIEGGDVLVTMIHLFKMQGVSMETCLRAAFAKIHRRKGEMVDGFYVREK